MTPDPTVEILDYLDSDEGADAARAALQAAGLPFTLDRPAGTWSGVPVRMRISVPADRLEDAYAALNAAARTGALVAAEGDVGLDTW